MKCRIKSDLLIFMEQFGYHWIRLDASFPKMYIVIDFDGIDHVLLAKNWFLYNADFQVFRPFQWQEIESAACFSQILKFQVIFDLTALISSHKRWYRTQISGTPNFQWIMRWIWRNHKSTNMQPIHVIPTASQIFFITDKISVIKSEGQKNL